MKQKLTKKEEARLIELALKAGVSEKLLKGIKGNNDGVLGSFKDAKENVIEVSLFTDKEDREYISQVKILKDGTRTKGFAVPKEDFKAYVGKLNSIADKM